MNEFTYATGGRGNAKFIAWCTSGDSTDCSREVRSITRLDIERIMFNKPLKEKPYICMGGVPYTVHRKGKIIRKGGRG